MKTTNNKQNNSTSTVTAPAKTRTPAKRLTAKAPKPASEPKGAGKPTAPSKALAVVGAAPAAALADPAVMPKGFKFKDSDRDPREIMQDHLEFLDNGRGVKVKDGMTLEELLPAMDFQKGVMENAAFNIGDMMVWGRAKFGNMLDWAMEVTGRARSTVANYERVCLAFPQSKRTVPLQYSYYQRTAALVKNKGVDVAVELLTEAKGSKTSPPISAGALSKVINTRFPRAPKDKKNAKRQADRRAAKGAKARPRKAIEFYSPDKEELTAIDNLYEKLDRVNAVLGKRVTEKGKDWGDLFVTMDLNARKTLVKALGLAAELHKRVSFKLGYV